MDVKQPSVCKAADELSSNPAPRELLPREPRELRALGARYVEQSGPRYDYERDPCRCPVCGGLGVPWAGWFFCDGAGDCRAIALVNGGAVFLPEPVP